jgi:hypothetical protein
MQNLRGRWACAGAECPYFQGYRWPGYVSILEPGEVRADPVATGWSLSSQSRVLAGGQSFTTSLPKKKLQAYLSLPTTSTDPSASSLSPEMLNSPHDMNAGDLNYLKRDHVWRRFFKKGVEETGKTRKNLGRIQKDIAELSEMMRTVKIPISKLK